jgi:hypothetical protein
MSDHIRIGLQAHDFDELGDARIKVRLPRGEVITILVPGFGPDHIPIAAMGHTCHRQRQQHDGS